MQRSAGREFLVGKLNTEAALIVLLRLFCRVPEGGVVPIAGHVHAPDIHTRIAVGHPRRQRQAHTATLRQSSHDATRRPKVSQAPNRSDERVAIWRKGKRSVDNPLDTDLLELWIVLKGNRQRLF